LFAIALCLRALGRLDKTRELCVSPVFEHKKEQNDMSNNVDVNTVFVQLIERPARRLILQRAHNATGYWDYCAEVGFEVWGILTRVKGALNEPIGLWMPELLRQTGTSIYVQGVEMPADYTGPVPERMEIIDLPACKYMMFQGQPFNEGEMSQAGRVVSGAMESYKPEAYGWRWADEDAPRFELSPLPHRGCAEARPVRAIG
jgi:AraC family transcriptional regulator